FGRRFLVQDAARQSCTSSADKLEEISRFVAYLNDQPGLLIIRFVDHHSEMTFRYGKAREYRMLELSQRKRVHALFQDRITNHGLRKADHIEEFADLINPGAGENGPPGNQHAGCLDSVFPSLLAAGLEGIARPPGIHDLLVARRAHDDG